MPKHIESRDRVVNLLNEAGVEAFDTCHGSTAFPFAAQHHEARAPEHFARQPARDAADEIEALLLRHRADHSTDDRSRWPPALTAPVARPLHLRHRQA